MPRMFSCTEAFKASYLRNTRRNRGMVFLVTRNSPMPSTGMVNRKMKAILPPMIKPMAKEKISIRGLRTAVRIIII